MFLPDKGHARRGIQGPQFPQHGGGHLTGKLRHDQGPEPMAQPGLAEEGPIAPQQG